MTATNMCPNFGGFRYSPPLNREKNACIFKSIQNFLPRIMGALGELVMGHHIQSDTNYP